MSERRFQIRPLFEGAEREYLRSIKTATWCLAVPGALHTVAGLFLIGTSLRYAEPIEAAIFCIVLVAGIQMIVAAALVGNGKRGGRAMAWIALPLIVTWIPVGTVFGILMLVNVEKARRLKKEWDGKAAQPGATDNPGDAQ